MPCLCPAFDPKKDKVLGILKLHILFLYQYETQASNNVMFINPKCIAHEITSHYHVNAVAVMRMVH